MIRLTILGEPASKANSREIMMIGGTWARNDDGSYKRNEKGKKIREGGRPMVIKSEKARKYEEDALKQIPPAAKQMLQGAVKMTIRIFYATERPDLDESIILDVLQSKFESVVDRYENIAPGEYKKLEKRICVRKGVYINDRQVRERHVYHAIDRKNPRAEIEVEPLVHDLFAETLDEMLAPLEPMYSEELAPQ